MMTNENTAKLVTDMATKANENMKQLGELQMNLWNQLVQKQVSTFNTVRKDNVTVTSDVWC